MKPFYILAVGLLLAASCKKDPIKALPTATQEGKNTMGCLVDGKAWTPVEGSTLIGGNSPVFAQWSRRRNGGNLALSFTRSKKDETQTYMYFFIPGISRKGTITLDQSATPSSGSANPPYAEYIFYSSIPYPKYLTGPDATGTLALTRFDTVACIAAGTFSFTGRYAASGQTVQVTEGRFDVRFTKQ